MSDKITTDEWQAEIARVKATSVLRSFWEEEEINIVRQGYGQIRARDILIILNKVNAGAGRSPRTLPGLQNYIGDHKDEWNDENVRQV